MNQFEQLSPELAALDQQLSALPQEEPSEALRQRVDLSIERDLQREAELSWGWFAATAAAVLLLIGNFSISAAAHTYAHLSSSGHVAVGSHTVDQLQSLLPELSREEASRHVVLLGAAGRIVPSVKLSSELMSAPFQSLESIETE